MSQVVLILGGARSGKSHYATHLAQYLASGGEIAYVATAQAHDQEMADRIASHQRERPPRWQTVEEPLHVPVTVERLAAENQVVVVDCVTLWISNLLLARGEEQAPGQRETVLAQAEELTEVCHNASAHLVLVANEVGLGVVPTTPLGRLFRDVAGLVNQRLSQAADEVYMMWAGLPQKLKGAEA